MISRLLTPRYLTVPTLLGLAACLAACGGEAEGQEEPSGHGAAAGASSDALDARVEVARLAASEAALDLTLPGEVAGSRDAVLGAALGGYIERVLVENGDQVRSGQVLVRVDTTTQGARVAQAHVELVAAEREKARADRLGDALTRAQRDAIDTRVDAARAAHHAAQIAMSRAIIRAPFDGTIANVDAEVGEIAPPGAPIVRLVNLEHVKVTVNVSDRDVVALREGADAVVTTDAASGMFHGTVSHINPAADLQTRAFMVEIDVENPEHTLLPGMIAHVRVQAALGGDQLVVPQDFVVTKLEGLGVFVEDHGVAHWRPVTLGSVVRDKVVVTSGLAVGDRVIVTGHRDLQDGDRVHVNREGECCAEGRVHF